MRRACGILLAASLGLLGCELPGTRSVGGATLDPTARAELAAAFRDLLSAQQARQQVNVTASTLIADNSAGLISNNGASLTTNLPLVADNSAGLISNNESSYRLAATREKAPGQHHVLPDGSHFYRLGNPAAGDTLVETFVTRVPNAASEGFEVADADLVMHAKMVVTLQPFDPVTGLDQPVTNRYQIEVVKSPVFTDYQSEVRITALPLGKTQQYVEDARYKLGALPVTAQATHSAFATFAVEGVATDLPTAGEERIRIGETRLALTYQNVSGQGVGSGTWTGRTSETWPLTYTYDFGRNLASMRVSLPQERALELQVRPGMEVTAGKVVSKAGETLATLAKREDGAIVLRFGSGDEAVLFE